MNSAKILKMIIIKESEEFTGSTIINSANSNNFLLTFGEILLQHLKFMSK